MKRALILLMVCLWLGLAAPGRALAGPPEADADRIAERAFLKDPAAQWQVDDLPAQRFTPYRGPLNLGNANVVTWLRLTLRPSERDDWVLLIQPAFLSELTVYSPRDGGGWHVDTIGSKYAYKDRPREDLGLTVPLRGQDGPQPTVLYVRVLTPNAAVATEVISATAASALNAKVHALLGIYGGVGLAMMLLSLTAWVSTRQSAWLASGLFDACTLVLMALQFGLVAKYIAPGTSNLLNDLTSAMNCAHLFACSLFYWRMITLFEGKRWCRLPYQMTMMVFPALLLLIAIGKPGVALSLNNLMILLLSAWGTVNIFFVKPKDRIVRVMWVTMTAAIVAYMLYWVSPLVLKLAPPPALSLYPVLPTNLFTMVMVVAILARYTQVRSRELASAEQARRQADQRFEQERREHQGTSGVLSMLVHEVRNPLALIQAMTRRLSNGKVPSGDTQTGPVSRIDQSVREINEVLERFAETDQLERGALEPRDRAEDAAERLREWLARHRHRARIQAELPSTLVATLDVMLWLAMVRNLVDNAIKYGAPDQPIVLRLHEHGGQVCVDVSNGEGPAGRPDPARLFDKYYRSERTEGLPGTGLGLYWVRRLSERLGGRLEHLIAPAPEAAGGAIVFRLSLPI